MSQIHHGLTGSINSAAIKEDWHDFIPFTRSVPFCFLYIYIEMGLASGYYSSEVERLKRKRRIIYIVKQASLTIDT